MIQIHDEPEPDVWEAGALVGAPTPSATAVLVGALVVTGTVVVVVGGLPWCFAGGDTVLFLTVVVGATVVALAGVVERVGATVVVVVGGEVVVVGAVVVVGVVVVGGGGGLVTSKERLSIWLPEVVLTIHEPVEGAGALCGTYVETVLALGVDTFTGSGVPWPLVYSTPLIDPASHPLRVTEVPGGPFGGETV